jgi:hypothetical protein
MSGSTTPPIVNDTTVGSTTFTAPSKGTYEVVAVGAQGGTSAGGTGGLGEQVSGVFAFTANEMLTIAVGGSGGSGGGGGGDSFVVVQGGTTLTFLVIAGGGGGNASAGTSGGSG